MPFRQAILVNAAVLLAACAADGEPVLPTVSAGAIKVADDLYMVPLGPDAEGCDRYRPFARRAAVIQALHYRARDGRFVPDRLQANCPAPAEPR